MGGEVKGGGGVGERSRVECEDSGPETSTILHAHQPLGRGL